MASSTPVPSNDPLTEHKAILALIHKFLSGIKLRNPTLMHSCILPSGHALLIRPIADKISSLVEHSHQSTSPRQHLQITLPEVIDRIPFDSPVSMEENIALTVWEDGDDGDKYGGRKSEIRVDGDIAFAWTPYEVRLGGVLHHVGTNVFSFVRRLDGPEKGSWVIAYVGDTFKEVQMS
ncbi:hypothetical protein DL95DRAFT_381695 [Leptodontidium sp. 2 PMI_412]|nr:hypothetical protein DL95DRAFT_381695 [Leptodontidium sp. 2 PMI_412]